ncbi:hypothetical protein B0H13DRAFT_2151834, partial [Mycena leptocephala]
VAKVVLGVRDTYMVLVALVALGWVPPCISLHITCMPHLLRSKHSSLATSEHLKLSTTVLLHQEYFRAGGVSLTKCIIFSLL